MKKTFVFTPLLAAAILLAAGSAPAQEQAREAAVGKSCAVQSIAIKTGVDEATNTLLPLNASDQSWLVTLDPDPTTTEPRTSTVIQPHPAWAAPLPGSQWISSYSLADNNLNGLYRLESCFCLRPDFSHVSLNVQLLADDGAEVFLNNNSIGQTTGNPAFQPPPANLTTTNQSFFKAGKNCIRVDLKNTAGVAMGVSLSATVQGSGLISNRPQCCDPAGSISGRKWNDLNGDGQKQVNEPVLPGWVIQLSTGQVAMTDSNGFYYFLNLTPGSYVVSEQHQAGWQQTYPLSGSYAVNLAAGQAVSGQNFGNRRCPQCTDGNVVFFPAGANSDEICGRLCCKQGEFFFRNSCGCGCSTKPPCPEIGEPGVHYVSRDPAVCATLRFTCDRPQEEAFSNQCGCGCRRSSNNPTD